MSEQLKQALQRLAEMVEDGTLDERIKEANKERAEFYKKVDKALVEALLHDEMTIIRLELADKAFEVEVRTAG